MPELNREVLPPHSSHLARFCWRLFGIEADLSFRELARRVWKEMNEDDIWGLAAQMSFYFQLAFFPFLIFVMALIGYVPWEHLLENMLDAAGRVLPGEAYALISHQARAIMARESSGLLSLGIAGALWAASGGVVALMGALTRAYDARESRSYLRARAVALLSTVALALLLLTAFALLLAGDWLDAWLASIFGPFLKPIWALGRWLLILLFLLFSAALVYYFLPNVEQDWRWVTPGGVLAVVVWIIASLGFKLYVANLGDYNATYGSVGAAIVFMLWLYISSLILLVGAEINSELDKASSQPGVRRRAA